jgi:hypothetical protein
LTGLSPGTTYTFRVKAREAYLYSETGWSAARSVRTGAAPGPVAHWDFAGGDRPAGGRIRNAEWVAGRRGKALRFTGTSSVVVADARALPSTSDFTWAARIKTAEGGTIVARAGRGAEWAPGGKVLFVRNGRLNFDVGWVGVVRSTARVDDGRWHHVAVTVDFASGSETIRFHVDGTPAGGGTLEIAADRSDSELPVKIGYCNDDFPEPSGFVGDIEDVRWYGYVLREAMIADLAGE